MRCLPSINWCRISRCHPLRIKFFFKNLMKKNPRIPFCDVKQPLVVYPIIKTTMLFYNIPWSNLKFAVFIISFMLHSLLHGYLESQIKYHINIYNPGYHVNYIYPILQLGPFTTYKSVSHPIYGIITPFTTIYNWLVAYLPL